MDTNKEILNKIAFLKEAINDDKLVVFAGSGVSVDSGLPLWKDLLTGIKSKLNFNAEYEYDALKISQLLFNEKGEKEYNSIIKEIIYRKSNNKYNSLHRIIFELNPQHIVTTNYDNFFEQIVENEGLAFSLVVKDEDLPYAKHKNLLIKYHGDFDNHNIVLKETDYLEFTKNHTLKEIFVKSLFSNKVILFVGYSFSDINLKLLSREMQYLLKKHHQRAYMLNLSNDLSQSEKTYYENLGINIINYDQAEREIPNLSSYFNEEQLTLSSHSVKVYKILNYLKCFDLDKHKYSIGQKLEKDDTINELHNALYRFYFFRVLPERFIARMYPLTKNYNENENYLEVRNSTIVCYNEDLFEIIKSYTGEEDQNYTDAQKEKLNYSINRLIWSGVSFLTKPLTKPTHSNFKGDESTKISLEEKVKYKTCDCINCNVKKYNFSKALKQLDNYIITETSELYDDLAYAFGLLSFYKNFKSYHAFKQLFVKANRVKKYEISFLAKHNMYRIGKNMSVLLMQDLTQEEIDLVKNEVNNIDLDRELNKIRYFVDEKMFEFLREIKNGVYIQNLCNDVDENYFKIFKTKNLIKRGGSSSNNDINNLHRAIINLEDFREYNFLYGNGFSRIQKTLEKSISAFFTAYSIKQIAVSDSPRLFGIPYMKHYDNYILKMIVNYIKPNELLELLKDNDLNNVEINDSIHKFIAEISNLLDSAIESSMYSDMPGTKFISELIADDNFAYDIKSKLDNICIIIAYFDFNQYHINTFIEKINKFISHVRFIQRFEYKYLSLVIEKKYTEIETSHLLDTLELFHKSHQYTETYFLLIIVLKLKDENFILKHFDIQYLDFNYNIHNIDSIYSCLEAEDKNEFKDKLNLFLMSEEARTIDLCMAIDSPDFVTDEIIDKYKIKINSLLKNEKTDKKYNRNHDVQILNFIKLYYAGKINTQKIEKSKIKHDYYRFLLNPERYPKDKFNPAWLKTCTYKSFISRFKRIPYIVSSLENFLMQNEDTELSDIYFKLKR